MIFRLLASAAILQRSVLCRTFIRSTQMSEWFGRYFWTIAVEVNLDVVNKKEDFGVGIGSKVITL